METKSIVELLPWDPESEDHVKRLVAQRVQCGWDVDAVTPEWRDKQIAGKKCLYWLILSPQGPNRAELLASHAKAFPDETVPLKDTAKSIRSVSRTPTNAEFLPVGHVSLDVSNPMVVRRNVELDLPKENVYWIKSLYVSRALRGSGLGRATMDLVEKMAELPPLNAKTLALDTLRADEQVRAFKTIGIPQNITNQAWYTRRGYRLIKTVEGFYSNGGTDESVDRLHAVFMRRDLE